MFDSGICFTFNFCFTFLFRYTMSHISHLFKAKGSDCWWELPLEALLPEEVLQKVSTVSPPTEALLTGGGACWPLEVALIS